MITGQIAKPAFLQSLGDALNITDSKTLPNVTVYATQQSAKPSFADKVVGWVNGVTKKIELPTVKTSNGLDQSTLFTLAGVALAVAFILRIKKR